MHLVLVLQIKMVPDYLVNYLIKNKENKVIKQKQTSISNESNNGNEKQMAITLALVMMII